MLDLSGVLAPKEGRDIEVITREILDAKRRGGEAILTIGRCLTEAKQALPHGEWLPWLNERVEFSERTAQNFMRLAREWSNPPALADMGAAKALTLLALPAEERESFIAENHVVGGEEKTVIDMTSRELEKAIRERKEAQEAAAKAQAEASAAEQARAKMEEDMKLLNARLSGAQEDREQAAQAVARLEAQLAELKEKPVEVAVETVVDPEAIEKARAEAVAGMQEKLDKAREAKKRAEDKQKIAEEALEQARLQLEEQARAEKEKGDLARERPDPDDCRAPRLKGGPGLVSGIAWHTRADEPEPGAEIIIIDDSGFVDSNVYIGAGEVKEPWVRWDEVALWTQMPDGPTGTPGTVVPPENGWVPLQFVKGMECPPSDGKYYCRFDCDGTVITQVAWWDGFSKSWSFKKAGAKFDAKCMGWFPLPDENL